RQAALERIRDIFGKDIDSAKTPEARRALAAMLLTPAREAGEGAEEWSLLDLAETNAIASGDAQLPWDVVDRRTERFAVSTAEQKANTLFQIHRDTRSAEVRQSLPPIANELVDLAVA